MDTGAVQVSYLEVTNAIHSRYIEQRPRPGPELDAFVAEHCEYFKIDERRCRRIVANADEGQAALNRSALLTDAQRQAQIAGKKHLDVIEKFGDLMEAKRRRAALDGNGNAIKDAEGNPVWEEHPDHRVQLAATDGMAKVLGTYAPKQVQVEATHEHHVNISDDELRAKFAYAARVLGFGPQTVDAEFATVEPGGAPQTGGAIADPAAPSGGA